MHKTESVWYVKFNDLYKVKVPSLPDQSAEERCVYKSLTLKYSSNEINVNKPRATDTSTVRQPVGPFLSLIVSFAPL